MEFDNFRARYDNEISGDNKNVIWRLWGKGNDTSMGKRYFRPQSVNRGLCAITPPNCE